MADATYYGTTDEGTDLYYGPGGSFVDENGVTLGIASGTNINLASGDSIVYGGSNTPPPPPPNAALVTADGGGGSTGALSGVADIFTATGNAITGVFKTLSPSRPISLPGQVGSYVYNPQTGQYMPAAQGSAAQSQIGTVFLFAAVALVLILAMKH
jgi:hypothetical protein